MRLTAALVATALAAAYLGFAPLLLRHDKALHFGVFFLLTCEFFFMWETKRPWRVTLGAMAGASVVLEWVQPLVSQRRFDPLDIVCNLAGTIVAIAVCSVASASRRRRRRGAEPEVEPQEEEDYVNVALQAVPADQV